MKKVVWLSFTTGMVQGERISAISFPSPIQPSVTMNILALQEVLVISIIGTTSPITTAIMPAAGILSA